MADAQRMAQEVQKAACPTVSSMWLIGMNVVYFCFGVTLISLSSWGIQQNNAGTSIGSGEAWARGRQRGTQQPAAAGRPRAQRCAFAGAACAR